MAGAYIPLRMAPMSYDEILQRYRETGQLFEDPDFPANDNSINPLKKTPFPLAWKRPQEMVRNPRFLEGGVGRFDAKQGKLQDCWFIAALTTLAQNPTLFNNVCIPGQSFTENYCGAFRFRFWRYGEWVEVIVDDKLPVYENKLFYSQSSTANEFWSALLEKAYAKMNGCYDALGWGKASEALQDFTGGVTEIIQLAEPPKDLFKILTRAMARHTLLSCSIVSKDPQDFQRILDNGLVVLHAYAVTGAKQVRLMNVRGTPTEKLIRIRNPWGNAQEWKGAWSDRSKEWRMLSSQDKVEMGLDFESDGEFWMSFEDFTAQFNMLEVCMLGPEMRLSGDKINWDTRVEKGSWRKHISAGGCRNFIETFSINPQYRISLEDSASDEDNMCSLTVALLRIDRRRLIDAIPIGFAIYKSPSGSTSPLDQQFFENNLSVARTDTFTKDREIVGHYGLPVGDYVIVPSSFQPEVEADFIIRIFSESPVPLTEIDEKTKSKEPTKPQISETEASMIDQKFYKMFHQISGQDREMDHYELRELLSYIYRKEMNNQQVSLDACRNMISVYDTDKTGLFTYEEFRVLWICLEVWKKKFEEFDRDRSGQMSLYELRDALRGLGYLFKNDTVHAIGLRYKNKKGTITFDVFIQIIVVLIKLFDIFNKTTVKGREKVSLDIDQFIESTMLV